MPGGFADRESLPKGPNGRALCRWCNLEVPARRFTFCSDWCVHEWKLRTDPGYLREKVFERDRGICAICGIDTRGAYIELRRSRGVHRLKLLEKWGLSSNPAHTSNPAHKGRRGRVSDRCEDAAPSCALKRISRKTLWDADHILAVAEGGGECDLENIRTLCLLCHRRETSALRQRLADNMRVE